MTLTVCTSTAVLGTITLADGKLTGSNKGVQQIADVAVKRAGSAEAAAQALNGETNGYYQIVGGLSA